MRRPGVVVIGAGPGGLAAAERLRASGLVEVTLVQRGAAEYLPGILPVATGMRPAEAYRQDLALAGVAVRVGEATRLEPGRVVLSDGSILPADAVIAAPGLATDTSGMPTGPRSLPVWELDAAAVAARALEGFPGGRLLVAIIDLPYRCPPAPYGLALTLRALLAARGRPVEVVLASPEVRPLQALGPAVSAFLEELAREGQVSLRMAFRADLAASRDGLLVAQDGQTLAYDLGLFVPPHGRPALLSDLPGAGPLVQVDARQRTALERTWVVGDVAGSPLPRAAGVAEAQGQTAAGSALAALGLQETAPPVLPSPSCYVWTSPTSAARIQLNFPHGLPPEGAPEIYLEPPGAPLLREALLARERWLARVGASTAGS
jgi:sulfide:quinone oxidoreductase